MPDIYTPAQVAECRERAERATEGPWVTDDEHYSYHNPACVYPESALYLDCICTMQLASAPNWREDRDFIAHARTDIPALCATVEALREENERLREALLQIVGLPDAHARSLEIAVDALAALEARDE